MTLNPSPLLQHVPPRHRRRSNKSSVKVQKIVDGTPQQIWKGVLKNEKIVDVSPDSTREITNNEVKFKYKIVKKADDDDDMEGEWQTVEKKNKKPADKALGVAE